MKKNCFKYKELLKKKGNPKADGASTNGKQTNQSGVAEKAIEEPCDVLSVNPGRGKRRFSDAWLLDSECTYHMYPRKEWFSIYEHFEGGTVLIGNDVACKQLE